MYRREQSFVFLNSWFTERPKARRLNRNDAVRLDFPQRIGNLAGENRANSEQRQGGESVI